MDHRQSDHAVAAVLQPALEVHRLPRPTDLRYEVKFTTDPTRFAQVLGWVRTHRAGWEIAFPDRTVNNVYFDSHDLAAYEANLAGVHERRKLRWRWYGEGWHCHTGTLEIKCRSGKGGWKWSSPAHLDIDLQRTGWTRFRDVLRAHLPPAYRFLFDNQPEPTVVNRYRRMYFASRDHKLRLTIDRDIQFWPQLGRARPGLNFAAHKADALVVEVKCAIEHEMMAADLLRDIPLRVGKHSKYALGVESLGNL